MNGIDGNDLRRELLHILTGIGVLLLLIWEIFTVMILFWVLVVGVFLSLLSLKIRLPVLSFFIDNFERKKDRKEFPGRGLIFAMVGVLLALKLFEWDIALASIAILTFADPVSHLVGSLFGKTKNFLDKRKNIEGHLSGFVVAALVAMFFVHPVLAISASLVAMLFESLIIEIQKIKLDDNLIIPLAAGTTMLLLKMFFM